MKNVLVALPAALAALVHVYIFVLETRITSARSMAAFGIRDAREAEIMKPWAYNQGWYNLLLAVQVVLGIAMLWSNESAGIALVTAGTGIMLAAAVVLITSDRSKVRAGVVQGLFPALALIAAAVHAF